MCQYEPKMTKGPDCHLPTEQQDIHTKRMEDKEMLPQNVKGNKEYDGTQAYTGGGRGGRPLGSGRQLPSQLTVGRGPLGGGGGIGGGGFREGRWVGGSFPQGTFGVHGASGAFGAHGRLRATPLATNCWPEAPRGGGGGAGVPPGGGGDYTTNRHAYCFPFWNLSHTEYAPPW